MITTEQVERKGLLEGLRVLENVLNQLTDDNNSFCIENAWEILRDERNMANDSEEE